MKRSLVFVMGCLLVAGVAFAQEKPNFSGTWVLDKAKSDPMGRPGGPSPDVTLIIEHKEPTLKIKQIIKTEQGERVQELSYTTDGKENKNPGFRGGEVITKSKWEDGKLVTKGSQTMETPQGTMTMELTEIRTLSEDGKTLTVQTTRTTPGGERTTKQVYTKQG